MAELELEQEVEYLDGGKWKKGTIHAVRKVDEKKGQRVIGYLIDTGKVARKAGFKDEKRIPETVERNHAIEQPVQVDVLPEDVRAVK